MGDIKQQLAAEADADAQAAAMAPVATGATVPATVDAAPEILTWLDQIDARLVAISAVIGAPPALTESEAVAPPAAEPAPEAAAPASDPVEAAVAEAAAPEPTAEWRDEVSYTLNPGEGIEVKLAMEEGQTARFFWTATTAGSGATELKHPSR